MLKKLPIGIDSFSKIKFEQILKGNFRNITKMAGIFKMPARLLYQHYGKKPLELIYVIGYNNGCIIDNLQGRV